MQIFKELKKLYGNPTNLDEDYSLFDEYIDPFTNKWKPPEHKYDGRRPNIGRRINMMHNQLQFSGTKLL